MIASGEELDELRRTLHGFIQRRASLAEVRHVMSGGVIEDSALWASLADELGAQAIGIGEQHGGLGLGPREQVVVLDELGRSLAFPAYLSSAVLATNVITHCATVAARDELLPLLASGRIRAAAAFGERTWAEGAFTPGTTARAEDESWLVTGTKSAVLDGAGADTLLVTARTVDGPGIFRIAADATGVLVTSRAVLDLTRSQADITFVDAEAQLISILNPSVPTLERAIDLTLMALAAEQMGGAERCLEMTREYLTSRTQFGRPLGAFQALKHRCASLLIEIETANAVVHAAADAAAAQDWPRLATLAGLAQVRAASVYAHTTAETIQLHGGIGFTWEHDAHLFFKRARSSAVLFGAAGVLRNRPAQLLGLA